jgi:hypothetical protein
LETREHCARTWGFARLKTPTATHPIKLTTNYLARYVAAKRKGASNKEAVAVQLSFRSRPQLAA